jgi:hypothetical protein
LSPEELLFLGMFQVRRFRVTQPAAALASVNEREGAKAWDGRIRGCVDSMVQYLVIVLIGENASRRFSGATFAEATFATAISARATFQTTKDGVQLKPSVADSNGRTFH